MRNSPKDSVQTLGSTERLFFERLFFADSAIRNAHFREQQNTILRYNPHPDQ